ncbi:MAG TPA: hypothetical protein VGB37_05390, partial [Candidatus Lokiarchaeia archaeon]
MSSIRDPGHAKIVGDFVKDLRKRIPFLDKLKVDSIGVEIEKGSVVGINMFNCGYETFPESLINLSSLKKLYLPRNKLSRI